MDSNIATHVGDKSNPHGVTASQVGLGNVNNTADSSKSVASAAKLTTARTIRTNLASTSTASFDGSANVTPGVTGTLPVANGGTGNTSVDTAPTSGSTKMVTSGGVYTAINALKSVASGSGTKATGWNTSTGWSVTYYKYGRLVHLSISMNATAKHGDTDIICTGLPAAVTSQLGSVSLSNLNDSWNPENDEIISNKSICLQVDTSGNLKLWYNGSIASSQSIKGGFTYISAS